MNKMMMSMLAIAGLGLGFWGLAWGFAGMGRATAVEDTKSGAVSTDEQVDLTGAVQATFAAGCFWGVEDRFMHQPGVLATEVGYTGGHMRNPTYQDVCGDGTGHAEAVHVWFDPNRVSYRQLVEFFFSMHNPTTPNRQGPDFGSQYRSAIFFYSPEQEQTAREVIAELSAQNRFRTPIVTEVVAATAFYRAEEYHQKYDEKHGRSCTF